jgi:DNA mismatch repair protein MutS2
MEVANAKAFRDLEYDRLKQRLKDFASSSLGKEALDALMPLSDRTAIEQGMAEVREAIAFLEQEGRFSLGGVEDLAPLLKGAKERSSLSGEELLLVLQTIEATRRVRSLLLSHKALVPRLSQFAERLSEMEGLARRLYRAIDERGELRDDASPVLKELRHKQQAVEKRVEKKLRVVIEENHDLISEPVVTRRAGRLVIPIKSGATGAMSFVVHDRSATGQTLYAEPTALVAENNTLAELEGEIREERLRILRELTQAFKTEESGFLRNRTVLAHLDSLFARASYALAHRCAFPQLSERISLKEARHPLLSEDEVVPISLTLGEQARMTVITGPNTGGKTVTLKTIGLLALMTQSVIPIPALADSELPIVFHVRSDIGDEQSIEQNLSTFSAHMKNIVAILRDAGPHTLVLLDELGAGTDPQEGAALGLAILEALLETGSLVAVSTHLPSLKYFAIRHPAVKTASMEFDIDSLSPTFHLVEGIPGKSQAFVIARRLGLSGNLVDRARSFLTQGEVRAEDIIDALQRERQAMVREREKAERAFSEAREEKEAYEQRLEALEGEREEGLSSDLKTLSAFVRRSQERVETLLAGLKAPPTEAGAKDAYHELTALREEIQEKEALLADRMKEEVFTPAELEVGRRVHVRSLQADGSVVQFSSQGKVMVDLDGIRVSTEISDLEPAKEKSKGKRPSWRLERPSAGRVALQLNVRGMTISEALREVAAYLDRLLLADVRQGSILHGKGTGALREAIRSYLQACSFVVSYRSAALQEGGDGVTVFVLAGDEL